MIEKSDDVAVALAARPRDPIPADFLARVNARIDAEERGSGWLGVADFRVWTLRLAPVTAVVAVIALAWPAATTPDTPIVPEAVTVQAESFAPASADAWQEDVSADALLDAALQPAKGGLRGR